MLILRIGKIQYYSNTLKRLQQISYLNGCPKYLIREKKQKQKNNTTTKGGKYHKSSILHICMYIHLSVLYSVE